MKLPIKNILLTIAILALVVTGIPEAAFGASGTDYVKVGLKYGSTGITSCTLTSAKGFNFGTVSRSGFSEGEDLSEYITLKAYTKNGLVYLEGEDGEVVIAGMQPGECVMPVGYEVDGVITFDGKSYRGGIMLRIDDGKLTVVNFLPADRYVGGALHKELSQSNPLESLKAQAVAVRSFVINNLDRHKEYGFDVCDTIHCQVYSGYVDEYPKTNQAVEETRGQILWHQGAPVEALYSKNSGGYTQNSEDVWGTTLGYLRSVKDEYSPIYTWTATIYYDNLKQKLEQAGYNPGRILSVSVGSRNQTGYVSELVINGETNTVRLQKENIRYVLGSSLIRSRNFILATETGGTSTPGVALSMQGEKSTGTTSGSFYAISGDGKITSLSAKSIYVSGGTTTSKAGSGTTTSGSYLSIEPIDDAVQFSGLGYGHGVGMSQDGAIAMGQKGFDYITILKYYYTDIEVN